ncbi:hypothetical protein [Kitasatospora azatica]|uniref:hypothetical protein n=1 Tax=Kitasatospora azatica TaxID=58347 RepID=UPI0005682EEB|nr:hypothetical protein [Kitasatospora azatica]
MGDIAKGAFSGAWSLLVGWILPTAINLGIFFIVVWPGLRTTTFVTSTWPAETPSTSLLLLTGSVLLGLVFFALRTPLYRLLEGYLLWPGRLAAWSCARHVRAKQILKKRRSLILLATRQRNADPLTAAEVDRLNALRDDPQLRRYRAGDGRSNMVQRALLGERLRRYPADDEQITPTRLGNAIRRFEEYGHNRFRLDSQILWEELVAVAPEPVRHQTETARTNVDFFIALLYGHLLVATAAAGTLASASANTTLLLTTGLVLTLLALVWYRCAIAATDSWAAAVRALVNVGRKPLTQSLGLELPETLADERDMWTKVTRLALRPYGADSDALDLYRIKSRGGTNTEG